MLNFLVGLLVLVHVYRPLIRILQQLIVFSAMPHVSLVMEALRRNAQAANRTLISQAPVRIAAYATLTTSLIPLQPHVLNVTSPAKPALLQGRPHALAATPMLSSQEPIRPPAFVPPHSSLTLKPTIVPDAIPRAPPAQEAPICSAQLARPTQCYQAPVLTVANARRHPFQIRHLRTASCVILPV